MRQTPLIDVHESLGASIGVFAGVRTALDFGNPLEEHLETRRNVTVFDLSHMGRIVVRGTKAREFLNRLLAKDLEKSCDLRMFGPTAFLNERAGFVDDVMLYRLNENEYLIVCNAVNVSKVIDWLHKHKELFGFTDVVIEDLTERTAMIAIQGPRAAETMINLGLSTTTSLKPLEFVYDERSFVNLPNATLISRSGWTGEDGFEVIGSITNVKALFVKLVRDLRVRPAGLIARDSLRIEMGFCLYGNEIDEDTNPLEARYWVFDIDKQTEYVGRDALFKVLADGVEKIRLGLRLKKGVRFVPRKGYEIYIGNKRIGVVTSGTYSPILQRSIALAYIDSRHAVPGLEVEIDIRGRRYRAKLVDFPFVQPSSRPK